MTDTSRADAAYQPVLRRRDSAWRYLVVIGVATFNLFPVHTTMLWLAVDVTLALLALATLRYRRRRPLLVATATVAAMSISFGAAGPMLLATVSLATRRRWREVAAFAVVYVAAFMVTWNVPIWDTPADAGADASFLGTFALEIGGAVVLVAWGMYIGSRRELLWTLRERAYRLQREHESLTDQARDAERARVALEMHDVLAHRISQIAVDAGSIAFGTDLDADDLRTSSQQLQASANLALDDLRIVLGMLRSPDWSSPIASPQPRASDIGSLIESARAEGMRVVAAIEIDSDLDDTIGRTLYRITQEFITNARDHAPGATLTIRISASTETGVHLMASNPIPVGTSHPTPPRPGFGLIGLTERVELAGGTLDVSSSHAEFVVTCHLPCHADRPPAPREYAQ